jgi:hypothetical protein
MKSYENPQLCRDQRKYACPTNYGSGAADLYWFISRKTTFHSSEVSQKEFQKEAPRGRKI